MKKIVSLSLTLIMAMALVGCNSNDVYDPGSGEKSKPITLDDIEKEENLQCDLIPMVMINDKLYFDTNKVSTEARCGVMDGEITSEVLSTETPTENNQSNFGTGFGYQIWSNDTIQILIDGKWYEFEKKQDDWGITLTATDVTPTGLTIVCEQVDGEQQGELQTGSPYCLEVFEDNTWQVVSYLPQEYDVAWTAEAWVLSLNDTTEWSVEWEWLYGKLPQGEYKISKSIMDFIETGNYEEQTYYATFNID